MPSADRRLADAFWDLRDDAFDHPDRWQGVTCAALFQRLAETVEESSERDDAINWSEVAERMIAWRRRDPQN